jgi:hypothetical protein
MFKSMFKSLTISVVSTLLCLSAGTVSCTWALEQSLTNAATVAELKPRMKSLAVEAMKAGDLWTAIQADAYASQKLGVRSSGVIGNSTIIGNPLFAFPHLINSFWDRGDRLIVVSGKRIYQIAPDGYPLYVSIPLKLRPTYSSLSSDGRYLAIIERVISPVIKLDISVIDMSDGSEAWNATLPILVGDSQYGPIVISSEGRAVAFAMFDSTETIPRLHVVRASGNHVRVPAYFHALAVGTDGLWAIAEPARNLRADDQQWSVLAAGNVTAAISAASAKGMAVIVSQEAKPFAPSGECSGQHHQLAAAHVVGPASARRYLGRMVNCGERLPPSRRTGA